jgi:hypothetical protein
MSDLREEIVELLRPWSSERLIEEDLYEQADAILAIPRIKEALELSESARWFRENADTVDG